MRTDEKHASSRVVLFIVLCAFLGLSLIFNGYFALGLNSVSHVSITGAQHLAGLTFNLNERRMMEDDLRNNLKAYEAVRAMHIGNATAPALAFNPLPPGFESPEKSAEFRLARRPAVKRPENLEDVAFWPLLDLAQLIRSRQVSSVELTTLYLNRLKTYGDTLHCVITLTEQRAMDTARRADAEIENGHYRGPLHGLPYGAKDLLAVKGYPTTWGAAPFKDQHIDSDATVIQKLDDAGAVLVAKLSMGALAWGDIWFGGTTRNPWNPAEGSSGSSAGSASATSAGLVAFSIGTETWGSIVSPATRCRVSGLRPTFGRVSRTGAMALSWSMDKIGPICRRVEDCAVVFKAIEGPDGLDRSVMESPVAYNGRRDLSGLRIGYLQSAMDADSANHALYQKALQTLTDAGAAPTPVAWPEMPVYSLAYILNAEAAAAFDLLTRSGRDDLLTAQGKNTWSNVFRQSRFIPAVEYIQANRVRTQLMMQMAEVMKTVDVVLTPAFGGSTLLLTNLTGHPAVVVPAGVDDQGQPRSLTFVGQLFQDGKALEAARVFQEATPFHRAAPDLSGLLK